MDRNEKMNKKARAMMNRKLEEEAHEKAGIVKVGTYMKKEHRDNWDRIFGVKKVLF